MEPIIRFKDVSVIYDLGKSNETRALNKVSFEIYEGEYIIFFGPSGSGKSTILYSIAGLEFPTYGTVEVGGKNLSSLDEKELVEFHRSFIGMVFQAYYLIPSLSVADNVLLPKIFSGQTGGERMKEAFALLERFGIRQFADRSPRRLSGGQQQRVAIARSLINNPKVILADEPVGNLDSKSADNVMAILQELNEKDKKVVILVTHDPRFLKYAHRIYYLKDGAIVQEVLNYDRPQIVEKRASERVPSQLESLARLYPYLSKEELKARALTHYLVSDYSVETQERVEELLVKFLNGELSHEELMRALDRPFQEGGAGLYRQTAEDFGRKIEKVMIEARKLRQELETEKEFPEKPEIEVKAEGVRRMLLDEYEGTLTPEQLARLERAIRARVVGAMNAKILEEHLDRPLAKGGVGLNRRTAKNFTRRIELILSQAE